MVDMLEKLVDNPASFPLAMESLWRTMNTGGFDQHSFKPIKHFNGGLFAKPTALPLAPEDIHELLVAARMDWRDVEPAIFGTLLERALDSRERSKLGAHYTPRAYVERLVVPTIIEPLRADWERAQAEIEDALRSGKDREALDIAKAFHHELCTIRVLDPACGTGNFLYVSLELLKKLEGEVLEAVAELGEDQSRLMMRGETVDPHQFYGLELNPRAVPIADLVLWIGYLKWQLRNSGNSSISEPVLHRYGTIVERDAILAYDSKDLLRDQYGAPVTRWDGLTHIAHPITGELVPDPEARVELYTYRNPRPADWPDVEFIVGNPPFISARELRSELGDGYVDALGLALSRISKNADFVMYFWAKALSLPVRAIGFVATSRLRMPQNNSVFADALNKSGQTIEFAVPDHQWPDGSDSAAVRICMVVTSAEARPQRRVLITPDKDQTRGRRYSDDEYRELSKLESVDIIRDDLRTGASLGDALPLMASSGLSSAGVKPYTRGFFVSGSSVEPALVRRFANGDIIGQQKPLQRIIDANHLTLEELMSDFPRAYQHILNFVRPKRETERNPKLRQLWWKYEANRDDLRIALRGLPRYLVTLENSPRRYFLFLSPDILPDQKLRVVASDSSTDLAVLSSIAHELWSVALGGRAGKANTPVYNSRCFDTFALPDLTENPTLRSRLAILGERLDTFRKERLSAHDFLTMTGLYNMLARVRELEWKSGPGRHNEKAAEIATLSDKERDFYDAGQIAILKEIHDEIDALVLAAYGWSDLAPDLVGRPGATTGNSYKSDAQVKAEEELLGRLVALNQTRAAEEADGLVRWLRPDYQVPKLSHKVARPEGQQTEADLVIRPGADKPKWPTDNGEQITVLVDLLRKAHAPVLPEALAASFDGRNTPRRKERIASLLDTLTTIGLARLESESRYFIPR